MLGLISGETDLLTRSHVRHHLETLLYHIIAVRITSQFIRPLETTTHVATPGTSSRSSFHPQQKGMQKVQPLPRGAGGCNAVDVPVTSSVHRSAISGRVLVHRMAKTSASLMFIAFAMLWTLQRHTDDGDLWKIAAFPLLPMEVDEP